MLNDVNGQFPLIIIYVLIGRLRAIYPKKENMKVERVNRTKETSKTNHRVEQCSTTLAKREREKKNCSTSSISVINYSYMISRNIDK